MKELMTLSTSTPGLEPTRGALRAVFAVGALAATSPALHAQQLAANQVNPLKQLSIAQLTNVMVTSVTRGPEPLSRSAAAGAVVMSGPLQPHRVRWIR